RLAQGGRREERRRALEVQGGVGSGWESHHVYRSRPPAVRRGLRRVRRRLVPPVGRRPLRRSGGREATRRLHAGHRPAHELGRYHMAVRAIAAAPLLALLLTSAQQPAPPSVLY